MNKDSTIIHPIFISINNPNAKILEIRSLGTQIKIDNISWECYNEGFELEVNNTEFCENVPISLSIKNYSSGKHTEPIYYEISNNVGVFEGEIFDSVKIHEKKIWSFNLTSGNYLIRAVDANGIISDSIPLIINKSSVSDASYVLSENIKDNNLIFHDECNMLAAIHSKEELGLVTVKADAILPFKYQDQLMVGRIYDISSTISPSDSVDIVFYYQKSEIDNYNGHAQVISGKYDSLIVSDLSSFKYAVFHGNSEDGIDGPRGSYTLDFDIINPYNIEDYGEYIAISLKTTSFSGFFLHSMNNEVPLSINHYLLNIEMDNGYNKITLDNNNYNATLEYSEDGKTFYPLYIHSALVDNKLQWNTKPESIHHYYRAKIYESDSNSYSNVVKSIKYNSNIIKIIPNPVTSDILNIHLPLNNNYSIQIFNNLGELVFSEMEHKYINQLSISTQKWLSGYYYIFIQKDDVILKDIIIKY